MKALLLIGLVMSGITVTLTASADELKAQIPTNADNVVVREEQKTQAAPAEKPEKRRPYHHTGALEIRD